jgi:hypothetical protein
VAHRGRPASATGASVGGVARRATDAGPSSVAGPRQSGWDDRMR